MKHVHKSISMIAVVVGVVLAAAAMADNGQHAEAAKPMALRGVMAQLGLDMQAVTGAIATEDWARIATLAPKIARHAEPPLTEKARILAWLGGDAGKFRGFDRQVHAAATSVGEAAGRRDGQAVIAAFATVQQSCLGCHRSFRKSFVAHFYGSR